MHNFKGSGGTNFNFNSDLSGNVIIDRPDDCWRLEVPGQDLLEFVSHYVSNQRISELEQADYRQVLGLKGRLPQTDR